MAEDLKVEGAVRGLRYDWTFEQLVEQALLFLEGLPAGDQPTTRRYREWSTGHPERASMMPMRKHGYKRVIKKTRRRRAGRA